MNNGCFIFVHVDKVMECRLFIHGGYTFYDLLVALGA